MIAVCPVPTPPPVVILPGGTFVDCDATWVVTADGSIHRVYPITAAQLQAGWRRYCRDVHPSNARAQRVCFRAHTAR